MHFSKIFLSETTCQMFHIWHKTPSSTNVVKSTPLVSYVTPAEGTQFYIELYKENFFLKLLPLLDHSWKFDQT